MHRRDTLRRCAVLGATGGLSLLAGCSGGDSEEGENEESSLSVETFDYREGDSGNLVVMVTVKNPGDAEASGKLYLDVTAAESTTETEEDGDDTAAARESRDVTVPAGETETVEVPFEFTVEQFERDGSLDVDLRA